MNSGTFIKTIALVVGLLFCLSASARETAPPVTADGLRDVLVKAMDFQFDRSNITPFMMDRTRNERAARQILTNWARVLVNGLKEARVSTSGQQ